MAVVGAGPIGLATAVLLARQAGFAPARVAVFDRRIPDSLDRTRELPVDLRVFALSRASEKILRAADAWADIAATRAESYERMQVWHADVPPHGGDALVFDAAEIGERDLGVIAENNVLQAALAGAARRAGVALVAGDVTALEQERDAAVLHCGRATGARAPGGRRRRRAIARARARRALRPPAPTMARPPSSPW